MKIKKKEIIIVSIIVIALAWFMKKPQQASGGGGTTVNRVFQDMDNAQQDLYSWVEEGGDDLSDMWDEELNGAKVLFYNDK